MPNLSTFVDFSRRVYSSFQGSTLPENWILLRSVYSEKRQFRAAAFYNSENNQVIVAFSGLNCATHEGLENLVRFMRGEESANRLVRDWWYCAEEFVDLILREIRKLSFQVRLLKATCCRCRYPKAPEIFLTGHSLGAVAAELVTLHRGIPSVTFESLGFRSAVMDRPIKDEELPYCHFFRRKIVYEIRDRRRYADRITTYLIKPNYVNCYAMHCSANPIRVLPIREQHYVIDTRLLLVKETYSALLNGTQSIFGILKGWAAEVFKGLVSAAENAASAKFRILHTLATHNIETIDALVQNDSHLNILSFHEWYSLFQFSNINSTEDVNRLMQGNHDEQEGVVVDVQEPEREQRAPLLEKGPAEAAIGLRHR